MGQKTGAGNGGRFKKRQRAVYIKGLLVNRGLPKRGPRLRTRQRDLSKLRSSQASNCSLPRLTGRASRSRRRFAGRPYCSTRPDGLRVRGQQQASTWVRCLILAPSGPRGPVGLPAAFRAPRRLISGVNALIEQISVLRAGEIERQVLHRTGSRNFSAQGLPPKIGGP